MASENGDSKSGAKPEDGWRPKGQTIDLEATEVKDASASSGKNAVTDDKTGGPESTNPAETRMNNSSSQQDQTAAEKTAAGATSGSLSGGITALVAGIIGGLIVAGGLWATGYLVPRDALSEALNQRLAGIEKRVGDVAARPADAAKLEDQAKRLAAVEKAVSSQQQAAPDAALDKRLTSLNAAVTALRAEAESLSKAVADANREAQSAVTQAGTAASLARANQPTVSRADIDAINQRIAALEQAIKKDLEAVRSERVEHAADAAASKAVRLALVAGAIREAVLRGEPYAADLKVAKALSADPTALAPLEPFAASGVPTAAALGRELTALVPALREAVAPGTETGGFLERLQANAERLVQIRPVGAPTGDAPDKVLARIGTAAARADLAAALADLSKLPANARKPAEAWIKKAQARQAAIAASRKFDSEALGALTRSATQGASQ